MWLNSSCPKLFFSDDFIQAQQQLARWASEDVVSVVVMESDSSVVGPPPVAAQNLMLANTAHLSQNGLGVIATRTDFYPSPPSTTETESSGSVMGPHQQQALMQQQRRLLIDVNGGPPENAGRYPPSGEFKAEYKH